MSLMPCFKPGEAYEEGIIIGRLLAGYGEIEMTMCGCLVAVERIFDLPIRTIFGERGAKERIKTARRELQSDYANAGLSAELIEVLSDMEWCRQIRNQYSHCQWYWTAQDGLCFVNLEEVAHQPTMIIDPTANRHPVDVSLLEAQENFFWYVKEFFTHLASAYRTWDQTRVRGGAAGPPTLVYARPPKVTRPPAHN
jgi:hypothetical protein